MTDLWLLGGGNSPHFFLRRALRAVLGAAGLLLAGVQTPALGAITPEFETAIFAYNQPVPISDYLHEWRGPLKSGADGITRNTVLIGASYGAWHAGYVHRYDYEIKGSDDAAKLYFDVTNKRPLIPGRQYDVDLRVFHQQSQGLRLAHDWTGEQWSLSLGTTLLSGLFFTQGHLQGTAVARTELEYDYDVALGYTYSDDSLFKRRVAEPDGAGLTTDLRLEWRPSARWQLALRLDDVWGRLWWRHAPYTSAAANSQSSRIDEDGYVVFDPILSGVESFCDFSQRLHPLAQLDVRAKAGAREELSAGLQASEVALIPNLGWRHRVGEGEKFFVGAQAFPLQGAFGLEVQAGPFKLSYASDAWSLDEAHYLSLQLGVSWLF